MAGEGDVQFDGAARLQVAQIEQATRVQGVAWGLVAAARAGTFAVDTAATQDAWGRQVLRLGDPFGGVRHILARPDHGWLLLGTSALLELEGAGRPTGSKMSRLVQQCRKTTGKR